MTERLTALSLRASNFKCLRQVEIGFNGEITQIRGDSGQGKTALLRAIEAAFQGADSSMIRNGEDTAELVLDLSEATIRRVMSRDFEDVISIKDKATGKPVPKSRVKAFLRMLIGSGAIMRPLDWARLGAGEERGKTGRLREQRDMLLSAVPVALSEEEVTQALEAGGLIDSLVPVAEEVLKVDHSAHGLVVAEDLKTICYNHRKALNATADAEARALEAAPKPNTTPADCPAEELAASVEAASRALYGAEERERGLAGKRGKAERLRSEIAEKQQGLPDAEQFRADFGDLAEKERAAGEKIVRLREELAQAEEEWREIKKAFLWARETQQAIESLEATRAELASIEAELEAGTPNLDALRGDLHRAKKDLAAREAQDRHDAAATRAATAREEADKYTALVELFRDEIPARLLERMEMPVEGLAIEDGVVTFGGVPLHNLGTSEQIKVGVQVAARLNPGVGFVLVDGAESMGKKDLRALAEAAQAEGVHLIMTFVDADAEPQPGVIVMEDGAAKGAE
jgi:predicted  nucleic acid-binding Zn-ribbon protein